MELLAPAGSFEALKAAVSAGADAVYFGGTALNARIFGKNFTDEEVEAAAKYCRLHGVKAYLTLNTLVSDKEKEELLPFIRRINACGIDGVIVQDIGLARCLRRVAPELPIHASTQMTIHNLDGVKMAEKMGFTRAVLSRELPESQIKYICENSPIEIEAFIHGALCMCYSGQCYMSSVIGERSGNRGKCAQPCRKPYQQGYELSLKDLCMAQDLMRFKACGVHSLKVEGRMKSAEYVAGVISIYRKLIDENRNATEKEIKQLAALFSREGFTNAYFKDEPSKKMFGVRTEENKAQSREIEVGYGERKIKITAHLTAKAGEPLRLEFSTAQIKAAAEEQAPFIAEKTATTAEDCLKQIAKLGGTAFVLNEFGCDLEEGLFIPVGVLNRLRRACLEQLEKALSHAPERAFSPKTENFESVEQSRKQIVSCQTEEQALATGVYADEIRMPLHKIKENYYGKTCAVLPEVLFDREIPETEHRLAEIKTMGIRKVACSNAGHAAMCQRLGFTVCGEAGLNIFNSESIEQAKELGFSEVTLSFEANLAQVRDMQKSLPCSVYVYGRYPVMVIQNCLMKNRGGCIDFKGCSFLKDTTGRSFPVFCRPPHRNVIYNSVPLYLGDKKEELPDCGHIFAFTVESGDEAVKILQMYTHKEKYTGEFTRGFTKKKV